MKPIILTIAFVLLTGYQIWAQSSGRVKVKASADIMKELATEVKYRFPQFRKGEIHYLSGSPASALFNYNILLNEMHYIDRKGDTLALDQEHLIKHISIDGQTFYFDKQRGYQELVTAYTPLKLTKYEQLRIVNREKMSAYGQSSAASSIRSYNNISGENSYYKLNSNDVITLRKEVAYYLIDNNNRILLANKPNLLKLFSQRKKEIEKYLQETELDFTKEEDLQKLLLFCSQPS